MKTYQRSLVIFALTGLISTMLFISFGEARNTRNPSAKNTGTPAAPASKLASLQKQTADDKETVHYSEATAFAVTPALRDIRPAAPTTAQRLRIIAKREGQEKNPANAKAIRPPIDPSRTEPFTDPTLAAQEGLAARNFGANVVTNPLQNFDGQDMDSLVPLFGGRFAPPDTNAAVGPNHVVVATNSAIQVFNKSGVSLLGPIRISQLLVGIPNAADDDGDPIILYDALANRWFLSQFNLRFNAQNRMSMHVAISTTGDPTGTWFAYEFRTNPGRFVDYPHVGVWPNAYYMASNDFTPPGVGPFLGAGFYAFEREKMLAGNPTARLIGINSATANDGGFLPTNLDDFVAPPANTPNLFIEWFADEFGPEGDILRPFVLTPDFVTPGNSTLMQLADIPVAAFDPRNPPGRADIGQQAPGEGLDAIADRLMHALNFRVLAGGVQSYVLNWTVNVSGVNPTTIANYQAGIRWMELRRNPGTGAITINQQATYAPGSGSGTGRDLWMASVAQDNEGNIGLAANASQVLPALNPTAIYTGRLAGDPPNTTPQGEVDAMAAVTRGVQTATANRWGDYSSLFVDTSDGCTFWGAFEYVDSPSATFDWNTRVFSFKVDPQCVTQPRGTLVVNVTNCATGLPVQGASVRVDGNLYGTTGATGSNTSTLAPGTYMVTVGGPGFGDVTVNGVVITNGNTTTVTVCVSGVASIVASGSTITAESCQPPNNALDPGETVTVNFGLRNNGTAPTTNLVATLQATGGVTSPSGPQNYGSIPPDNTTVVSRPFTFTVDPSIVCGGTVTATLQLQDGATNLGTVTFTLQVGGLGAPVTASYSSGNIAVPIPDLTTVEVPINVPDTGQVQDVNVRVRLNHTFDADLVISLVHPDGTVVPMSNNRGGGGDNFGTGANDCSGTPTIFDDEAATPISAGVAPFAGTFRPDSPLSALDGKPSNGTWRLRVADTAGLDVGTIGCVTIEITRAQPICCGVAGTPNIQAGPAILTTESCPPDNNAIDPGERVTVNLELRNVGTGATTNLVATLQSTGGVTSPSDPQSYGVLTPTGPGSSATRDFTFTAAGACGSTITATWQLQDGATNLGTVTRTFVLGAVVNATQTFANPAPITIPDSGAATPYPSAIVVAGVVGPVSKVTVTLRNMNHTFPDDVDILLVGPGGQRLLLMSDAGGGTDIVNNTYTFDDVAAATLSDAGPLASGTFRPSNFGTGDTFPAPAPVGPYPDPQLLSVFNGVNPNGTWNLFLVDDAGQDLGNINMGWELNITTSTPSCVTPCGGVRLEIGSTLVRMGPNVQATITVANAGTVPAANVMLTTAVLAGTTGTPLPQSLGTINPGSSVTTTVSFATATTGSSTLALGGTFTGGTFGSTRRVTIP